MPVCSLILAWDGLNDWQRGFLESIRFRSRYQLSEKQRAKLDEIVLHYNLHREED